MYHKPDLPEITLSALAETDNAELTIPVVKQRSYTGNEPVISCALADTPCADLGIDGVLERLNATLGTSYSLGFKYLCSYGESTLYSILEPYVERNDDFGMVYAHLRHIWYDYDVSEIKNILWAAEEYDRKMRRNVLVHDTIMTRNVPPRRVWDLYSNRVVPHWVTSRHSWAASQAWGISHAWVDENDRVDAMTPINGYEWPVPIPKDVNLDLIRIEMLNHGAQYAWLDVLCLRQQGGEGEHLRLEEWKLDVPTIGSVYEYASVVCYFNGLGRPLHLTPGYFESDRSWFRRAWTLQEITFDPIIGGETGDDIMEKEVQKTFEEQLARLRKMRVCNFALEYVSEMRNRVSSTSLDKVAGLAYLLNPDCIPIYDAEMSDMDAGEVLMDMISSKRQAELFFYFPEPGNGRMYWRPSWQQIMTIEHFRPQEHLAELGDVEHGETDGAWYESYFIESADVRGLDEGSKEEKPRQGEIFYKHAAGFSRTFKILADHVYPIPDGSYALIGASNWDDWSSTCPLRFWVVGRLRDDRKFEKLSVFSLAEDEQTTPSELGLKTTRQCNRYGEDIPLSGSHNDMLRGAIKPSGDTSLRSDESIVQILWSKSQGASRERSGDSFWRLEQTVPASGHIEN
ncbi:hypothetical protein EDD18DRAFT_1377266 [Armillaria luteobubalina]|uniref:Heterokaryon incompatibility domain-containing protein n=1 Tax=Armillaria luteobubalina TaxID=153913 RepID=A0AA39QBW1_9AGAR|nr:hypothetical protein EDD18DRAFT_1377266 [Armillaria luteobubalina]